MCPADPGEVRKVPRDPIVTVFAEARGHFPILWGAEWVTTPVPEVPPVDTRDTPEWVRPVDTK